MVEGPDPNVGDERIRYDEDALEEAEEKMLLRSEGDTERRGEEKGREGAAGAGKPRKQ